MVDAVTRPGSGRATAPVPIELLPDPRLTPSGFAVLAKRQQVDDQQNAPKAARELFWGIAQHVAQGSAGYEGEEAQARRCRDYYAAMARLELLPVVPELAGSEPDRGPFGPYELQAPDSLTTLLQPGGVISSLVEAGSPLRLDLSRLPAQGEHAGLGPVAILEALDAAVFSLHGPRAKGRHVAHLDVDHPAILDFLRTRCELSQRTRPAFELAAPYLGKHQQTTLRQALVDGQLPTVRLSVGLTDRFMQAVVRGDDYPLVNPGTGRAVATLAARDVHREIVQGILNGGEPSIVFVDRRSAVGGELLRLGPRPGASAERAAHPPVQPLAAAQGFLNLCTFVRPLSERRGSTIGQAAASGQVPVHSGFSRHPSIDWERLGRSTRLAVRFLDDLVSTAAYPDEALRAAAQSSRALGLGVMGWADLLLALELPYDSQPALDLADEVMAFVSHTARDESRLLAETRGGCALSTDDSGGQQRRHATLTIIAPSAALAALAGCSPGVEPLSDLVWSLPRKQQQRQLIAHPSLEVAAKREKFWSDELVEQLAQCGSARGLASIPEPWQRVFATRRDLPADWHIRMQAAFQRHADRAVAKTVHLASDADVADVEQAIQLAYELGCHSVTMWQARPSASAVDSSSGGAAPTVDGRRAELAARPGVLQGMTFRQETPLGTAYVTINSDEQDQPYEIFVNQGKTGSDVAAMSVALGKLASLALGLPSVLTPSERLSEVARRLRGIGGGAIWGTGPDSARSLPDALARVLETYLQHHHPTSSAGGRDNDVAAGAVPSTQLALPLHATGDYCPECANALVYQEGSVSCLTCGYARS